MSIENLVIDNYPRIDINRLIITTEYSINSSEEISISINNTTILDSSDIYDIINNEIELIPEITLTDDDIIVVIYHKI